MLAVGAAMDAANEVGSPPPRMDERSQLHIGVEAQGHAQIRRLFALQALGVWGRGLGITKTTRW
jgi:hypothetical protein